VLLHTVRRRENLIGSMIVGTKPGREADAIPSSHRFVGLVFLTLTASWAFSLANGYDAQAGTVRLPLLGTTLAVGEAAEGNAGGAEEDEVDEDD
jgi:hypothetical protein